MSQEENAPKKTNPLLKGCLIIVILGFIFMGGCVVLFGVGAKEMHEQKQAEQLQIQNAPISDISWAELDAIYNIKSQYTDLQKDELWKKYEGKKVQWTGKVSSIDTTFNQLQIQIKMKEKMFGSDVIISIDDSQKAKALTLSKDSSITYTGILDRWGALMPISISDATIE